MEKSDSIKELASALARAQSKIPAAKMDSINPFLKSKYASLGAIIDASKSILSNCGLSVSQMVEFGDNDKIGITTILMHESGEWISSTVSLPIGEEKGKSQAQVAGSIISYLRRYSLASVLGMYSEEDVDGEKPALHNTEKPASRNPEKPVKEERPWKPDVLKKMLLAKAETKPAAPSTEQMQAIAACLEYILKSKGARYEFLSWVSSKPVKSSKDMDDNLLAALGAYLDPKYDKNGGVFYPKNENVTAEVTAAHVEYLKSIGQAELVMDEVESHE
jgi:hypothetical protein